MPKLLQVAQLGHSVLRRKAVAVRNAADKEIQELIDDLILTITDVDSIGLSASQVYESKPALPQGTGNETDGGH